MLTECFMHEHTIIQFILFNLFTIHSRIPGANGCVYLLSSALYEVAYLFWHVYCVVCTHQTIIRIPLNWMFFSPDDRMVRIIHINRFTGLWLIRATSKRIGDYLNECKIWHARQWTEFHSNIDWLLSFALYLFMVSTRAAEKMQSHWNSINSRLTLHHTSRDQLTLAESSFFCCRAWISHEHFCVLCMLLFAWQQWWRWRQPKRRPAVMLATTFYYLKIDIRMNCKSLTKQKIHLCECANE